MLIDSAIRRFLTIAPAVICGACATVGPDFETPAMDLPASFSQGGVTWKRESPGTQPVPRAWWKLYKDPQLNSMVDRSLAGNQDLSAAAARLR